ncbi:L-alanine exporter AlaE, partial [Klebsiella pneumoniae]|uniref:L-alanine exporter AlaE n=1 Tax=Klebsiella pneumoniae TaxID=573 RepID=UPI003018FAC6
KRAYCLKIQPATGSFARNLIYSTKPHQIVAAVSSNLAVSMMMGAAYGYFLDYCRRLFRVAPYQQAKA